MSRPSSRRLVVICLFVFLHAAGATSAAEIRVMTSGGFTAAYLQLVPRFERATGHKVQTTFGGLLGNGPETLCACHDSNRQ